MVTIRRLDWLVACLCLCLAFFLVACAEEDDDDDNDQADDDDDEQIDDDDTGDDDTIDDDQPVPFEQAFQALIEEYHTFSGEPGIGLGYFFSDDQPRGLTAGSADLIEQTPLSPEMFYRVGSMTKPFVATVVLQLVDEGVIGLDDLLIDYLPEYHRWEGVTVGHLLSMQSGVPDYLFSQTFWLMVFMRLGKPIGPKTLMSFVKYKPLEFEPGTSCNYGNSNYALLGMVIEKATGNPVGEEIDQRVVQPLGLEWTFLDLAGDPIDDLVHGYADIELAGPAFGLPDDLTGLSVLIPPEYMVDETLFDGTYLFHPSFSYSAGALVSCPDDLVRFMKAHVLGELVSPESAELMKTFTPCNMMGETVDYGMGMMRRPTPYGYLFGHGGKHFGYSNDTYYLPEADFVFSFLHNFVPDQNEGMIQEILDIALSGEEPLTQACTEPEDFFSTGAGPNVQLRFKGELNNLEYGFFKMGISHGYLVEGEDSSAVYGIDAWANVANGWAVVESYGPPINDGFDWAGVKLMFDPALLDGVTGEGLVEIGEAQDEMIGFTLLDVTLDPETELAIKRCVTGVPDFMRTSRISFCESDQLTVAPGTMLKLFVDLAVTRDEADIEAYLDAAGRSRCECKNEDDQWEPCDP